MLVADVLFLSVHLQGRYTLLLQLHSASRVSSLCRLSIDFIFYWKLKLFQLRIVDRSAYDNDASLIGE